MTETGAQQEETAERSTRWRLFRRRLGHILSSDFLILSILAAILGAVVGYAAIGFRLGILMVQEQGFGSRDEAVFLDLSHLPWWQVVLVPTLGGLAVGVLLKFLLKSQGPFGIADVMEAAAGRTPILRLREGLATAAISILSMGAGASTGREGPIVHLGATSAAWLGNRLHLRPHLTRTLLGCGAAAAVAASFNAPLAGVFFALEVVIGHYAIHAFAPIVLSAVAATMVSRVHMGDFPAFIIPDYHIQSFLELPAFILLGLASALVAVTFLKSWQTASNVIERVNPPLILRPAMAGLVVGLTAIWLPEILSVGYAATDAALKNEFGLVLLVLLIAAKTAATALCLAARFGGGVFSPSLFMGAMLGSAFGIVATAIFPEFGSNPGLYSIAGMGAVAAAVLGAPISTILIVFELTGDYQITLYLMVAVSVSAIVTRAATGGSFFHLQLMDRGTDLRGGRAELLVRMARVSQAMDTEHETIGASTLMSHLPPGQSMFLVVDDDTESQNPGAVTGILVRSNFRGVLPEGATVADMAETPPFLEPRDSLARAIRVFEDTGLPALPVIADTESRQPAGILYERAALRAYNDLLVEARLEEHGRFERRGR